MTISLEQRAALEQKYDGRIPAHLLNPMSDAEVAASHHRGMIRYSESRIRDFSEALAKLPAQAPSETRDLWISHTRKCIADHEAELARHRAALAAVTPAMAA